MSLYGTSAVKRLSKRQQAELDDALIPLAEAERPTSVRSMYYMAMGAGLVDKDQQKSTGNYDKIR